LTAPALFGVFVGHADAGPPPALAGELTGDWRELRVAHTQQAVVDVVARELASVVKPILSVAER
jgi:hypothetical protein